MGWILAALSAGARPAAATTKSSKAGPRLREDALIDVPSPLHGLRRRVEWVCREEPISPGWLAWLIALPAALVTGSPMSSGRQVGACGGTWTALPPPRDSGSLGLETALRRRRSVREFQPRPLSLESLAQLFWAAQGITDARDLRTAPSAGARYPLEVYAATERGLLHYRPSGHCVRTVIPSDVRPLLQRAAGAQESVGEAGAVFIIAAVIQRAAARYGPRAERYVHLEAGHAAQNVLLEATALDLGAVPVGAFDDDRVASVLELPRDQRPLYLIPVGVPR